MYGRSNLKRHRSPGGWELHFQGSALVRVVPDPVYAGMWRVRRSDGTLTDMANLTWARDAAVSIALGTLNRQEAAA
jgi:hypothetical protein